MGQLIIKDDASGVRRTLQGRLGGGGIWAPVALCVSGGSATQKPRSHDTAQGKHQGAHMSFSRHYQGPTRGMLVREHGAQKQKVTQI